MATARNHGLSAADLEALQAKAADSGVFPNPYRPSSSYGAIVGALIELGLNKAHPFIEVKQTVQTSMGDGWAAFEGREQRHTENSKDADGRLLQNCQTLMRRKDYGLKLTQLGAGVVKVKQPDGSLAFGLYVEDDRQAASAISPAKKKAAKGPKAASKAKAAQKATGKPKKAGKKATKPKT